MWLLERRLSELLDLLLMVVRLVAHGDFLLSDFSSQLTVHKGDPAARRRGLLLEDAAHVVEEPGGAGEEGGRVIHVVKEKPGVLIALFHRQREPADGGFSVLRNILSQQVQLCVLLRSDKRIGYVIATV